jgi:hypothetical protein
MIDLDDFLKNQLSTLARQWETDAPPITIDETIAMAGRRGLAALVDTHDAALLAPDESLVTVSTIAHRPNRRWKPLLMLGAAAALVLIGLVVLAERGNDQEPFRPGIETVPQPSAVVPVTTSATTTPATAPVTSPATPTTPPAGAVVDPATAELSTIQSSVAGSLATFDTFRATATMRTSTDGPVSTYEVTMASDGSVWATGSPITWQSYDATTGIARTGNASANAYMQLNLNPVPLGLVFGLAPIPRFDEFGANAVVEETEQDGRPVWEINSIHDLAGPDGVPEHRDETFDIDKATGLVIGYNKTSTVSGTTTVMTATLSNLVLNVDFPPPEFPGTFPPGADAGTANPIELLSVDEAATRFGAGFVVAPAVPQAARITFQSNLVPTIGADGTTIVGPPRLTVTMEFPTGFAPTSLTISKDADVAGDTSGGDPGSVCRTIDGKTCLGADGASVVTAGALKGAPSELRLGVLTIHDGLITVAIRASSDQAALALANSLVTVG